MKLLKLLGITVVVLIVFLMMLFMYLSNRPAVAEDYQNKAELGGNIEEKYMSNGNYEVLKKEEKVLLSFDKFLIFYPKELELTNKKYPVIVLTNGTGVPLSKYQAIAKHYASWGFIVIGTEEKHSWNAFGAEMSVRYLEKMNTNEKIGDTVSIFYQKIDFDNVGIVGHSQGGVAVFNAVTNTNHQHIYKTAVAISPTNKKLAENLMWDYDAMKITIPIMLLSGEGGGDDWVVTGEQLEEIYNDIPTQKLSVRRVNTDHGKMLYTADGYVTAWFMWQLQGDEYAKKAFVGHEAEVLSNKMYTDQKNKLDDN